MKNYSRPIVALCVLFVLKLIKIAFLIYSTSKAWKTILRLVWFLKLLKIAKNSCFQEGKTIQGICGSLRFACFLKLIKIACLIESSCLQNFAEISLPRNFTFHLHWEHYQTLPKFLFHFYPNGLSFHHKLWFLTSINF